MVRIHYRRLPDRETLFVQRLVHRRSDCIVTFMERTPLSRPLLVDGQPILEDDSPVVWFTFPGEWHDVGRFHTVGGRFTGFYANVLTPVDFLDDTTWRTTDLFLDVWLPASGPVRVLDEDELIGAAAAGSIDAGLTARAGAEARRIAELARAGLWPPDVVGEWPLERVLATLGAAADT